MELKTRALGSGYQLNQISSQAGVSMGIRAHSGLEYAGLKHAGIEYMGLEHDGPGGGYTITRDGQVMAAFPSSGKLYQFVNTLA